MSKRVLYVATVVKTHIMHFHIPYLKMFKERGWHTAVAARNDYENSSECSIPYCDEYYDIPFERSPLKLENITAFHRLKCIINEGNYDIVHCHTPVAAILTRLAARKARKKGTKILYTAHGFHFFKGASLLNWLIYFPAEWICAFMTDTLITINNEDYALAMKHMHAKRIEYMPGVGIDTEKAHVNKSARGKICQELGIDTDSIILLSVGELIARKNHQIVIRALRRLAIEKNVHYLIAGSGPLYSSLEKIAHENGLSDRVHLLGYRKDVMDLYSAVDIFVLPSYQEGLPVCLLEAMAHKLPCVVSKIRGNIDLINECGGIVFVPDRVDELEARLRDMLECERREMGDYNFAKVQRYSLNHTLTAMERIYKL